VRIVAYRGVFRAKKTKGRRGVYARIARKLDLSASMVSR
jgi:hypothetical protein